MTLQIIMYVSLPRQFTEFTAAQSEVSPSAPVSSTRRGDIVLSNYN